MLNTDQQLKTNFKYKQQSNVKSTAIPKHGRKEGSRWRKQFYRLQRHSKQQQQIIEKKALDLKKSDF